MHNPIVDRPAVMARIKEDFRKRDVAYDAKKTTVGSRWTALSTKVDATTPISQQILAEAYWLLAYSDDWARVSAVLDRLEASFGMPNQKLEQQPDGSWGPGFTEWYRKLEPTVDALNAAQQAGDFTTKPSALAFMQSLADPDWTLAYLDSLRTSHVAKTGRNNRDEFGAALTALSQLIFKPQLRKFLDAHAELGFKISDELAAKYKQYVWGLQSPVTGFWGPSYRFWDGSALEVQDLSFTFHIVHYYDDYDYGDERSVPMLPRIASTTLAISGYTYPNGWLNSDKNHKYLDHNNYDVVTLFDDCWPFVDPGVQQRMKAQIRFLIDGCFANSIQNNDFYCAAGTTHADAFYYGVRFLQVAGFWDDTAHWGQMSGPVSPKDLATALLRTFADKKYDDGSESALRVKDILAKVIAGQALPKFQMV